MNHSRRTFLKLAAAGGGALILTSCWRSRDAAALPPGVEYYTCTMHTFVRAKAPGKCPVCGMELIPVMKDAALALPSAAAAPGFTVPVDRQQQIGVTYALVQRVPLRRAMRAVGAVAADRQRAWSFVARTDGYVKKLFVTSPGELVAAGQPLLSLYSPDLFTAEREYVMLLGMRDQAAAGHERDTPDSLLASARARLAQWNVSDAELAALEKSRAPTPEVTLCSPFRGVVRGVAAQQGGNVKTGDTLVEVADLSRVWVWADFYEAEIGALRLGQKAAVTVSAYPGETFEGAVSLIDPFLDETERTFKVRIDLPNSALKLRPGMYADVSLTVDMGAGLVIPINAVMPTGSRSLVFVDRGQGRLEPRQVTLGAQFGDCYQVIAGLREGERIVSSATFLIDAEAQLQGALNSFDTTPAEVTQ